MQKIVIVAAMERELSGLIAGWPAKIVPSSRGRVRLYENGAVLCAVGGMGTIMARAAADAAYRQAGEVGMMVSAGLAGALTSEWNVGDIFRPATVIDDADGLAIETGNGAGTLITSGTVADETLKKIFAEKHIAQAVDMEAFAVADVARVHGVPFQAVKAISDELDFPMPPLGRFIREDGTFETGRFAVYAAMRPRLWGTIARLRSNSSRASAALCTALAGFLRESGVSDHYNRETIRR